MLEGWLHKYEIVTEHIANPNLSVVVVKCSFSVFWCETEPLCVQSLPQPWLDDRIFYYFLASLATVLAEDVRSSFLCGWFERPSSGVVGFYDHEPSRSCSLWLCNCLRFGRDQLVVGQIHADCGTLDQLMTDVPNLFIVWAAIVAPIGNSDHSSLSVVISMAQAVPNLCVSRKVFLKHQVNWNTVCGAIQDLPGRNIWLADNPLESFERTSFFPCWLDVICTNQGHPCA